MAHTTPIAPAGDARELSTGELVAELSGQLSRLVRAEMRLAQAELKHKGKHAGLGVSLAGGGVILALIGFLSLVAAGVAALGLVLPVWASTLVVGGLLLVLGATLTFAGARQARRAAPPIPEQAVSGLRADIETVRESSRRES